MHNTDKKHMECKNPNCAVRYMRQFTAQQRADHLALDVEGRLEARPCRPVRQHVHSLVALAQGRSESPIEVTVLFGFLQKSNTNDPQGFPVLHQGAQLWSLDLGRWS